MDSVSDILLEIGWDPGFKLPVANEYCKKLQDELTRKKEQSLIVSEEIRVQRSKLASLRAYYGSIKSDFERTVNLIDVKRKELESEQHLSQLAKGETGHVQGRTATCSRQLSAAAARCEKSEAEVARLEDGVRRLRKRLGVDSSAMADWLETMQQREDDMTALRQFQFDDSELWRRLGRQLESLSLEEREVAGQLVEVDTELASTMQQVDCTAENYRQRHNERQALLQQWERVLGIIEERERMIRTSQGQMNDVETEKSRAMTKLKDNEKFLQEESKNNRDIQLKFCNAEKRNEKLKNASQTLSNRDKDCQYELEAVSNMLRKILSDLKQKRIETNYSAQETKRSEEILLDILQKKEQADLALQEVKKLVDTVEEKNEKLQSMMQEEELKHKMINLRLSEIGKLIFEKTSVLNKIKENEVLKANEIKTTINMRAKLLKQMSYLNNEVSSSRYEIYRQETAVETLMKRIERMEGLQEDDSEKRLLQKRLKLLQDEMNQLEQRNLLVSNQIQFDAKLLSESHQAIEKYNQSRKNLQWKESEFRLHSEVCNKELRTMVEQRHSAVVQSTMLQLSLQQLTTRLERSVNKCSALGLIHAKMDATFQQRRIEAAAQREVLKVQLKSLQQEVSQLCRDVAGCSEKVQHVRSRYMVLLESLGGGEEDKEDKVHIYWLVRAAQEREQVKQEGDELDAKVQKTEAELKALINTRDLISRTNQNFERKFKSDNNEDNDRRRDELTEKLGIEQENFKRLNAHLAECKQKTNSLEIILSHIEEKVTALTKFKCATENEIADILRIVTEQRSKVCRARKNLNSLLKQIHEQKNIKEMCLGERNIKLTERRKVLKLVKSFVFDLVRNQRQNLPLIYDAGFDWLDDDQSETSSLFSRTDSASTISDSNSLSSRCPSRKSFSMRKQTTCDEESVKSGISNTKVSDCTTSLSSIGVVNLTFDGF